MGFRNKLLAREGFEHTDVGSLGTDVDAAGLDGQVNLENGGKLLVAPTILSEAINESLGLSSEVNAEISETDNASEATELASDDLETLDSMEESLENEDREVSEEEAETVKMITESFAQRYDFELPRELATEGFGDNRKDNRDVALKYVRAAKLGTEGFIKRTVTAAAEGLTKSINAIMGQPKTLRKMATQLRTVKTDQKNIGDVYGQSLFKTAGRNLVLNGDFIGDDLSKLRSVMDTNVNYDMASVLFSSKIIDTIVEKAKSGELDAAADADAIMKAVPELKAYADSIGKQFEEIGMTKDGEVELLGGRMVRLTTGQALWSLSVFLFLVAKIAIPIAFGNINDKIKRQTSIPAIQPDQLNDYATLLEDLASAIEKSPFLGRGQKGIFKSELADKKDHALETLGDVDSGVKKIVENVLTAEERAIHAQVKLRIENINSLVSGLVDYVHQSLSAYK